MKDSSRNSLLLVILLVVSAIMLCGTLGFYHFEKSSHENLTLWDSFWWTMVTVTTIGYGDIFPKTIGGRLIAIFLMFVGIGTLGVVTAAIAAYFVKTDQLQMMRLRRLQDHVVICGLGDKGLLLTKAFREKGYQVVAIEQNPINDLIQSCREQGALVVIGDATEREVLSLARVQEAKYLISVCSNDAENAEVAAHARDLVGNNSHRVLVCSTHIVDPELWYLLRKWEVTMSGSFRLQFFNVFDIGARALLDAYPPFAEVPVVEVPVSGTDTGTVERGVRRPHVLVVGGGRLGQSLVVHTARSWRDRLSARESPAGRERLRVTLIDKNTEQIKEFLHLRHPELEEVCEITTYAIDVTAPEFHRAAFLFDAGGHCDVTAIYVCVDEDTVGLSSALALHHRVRRYGVPVVVRMTQDAGLAALLHGASESGGEFDTLHAVALLERTCQPDLVLGGTNEVLARAIHDKYRDDQEDVGQTAQTNPLMAAWDQLPEEARESNRAQAAHISEKLKAVNCDIMPLIDWDADAFEFSVEEVDLMAQMEHERWLEERRSLGWTYGPRDLEKKTNPSLVPWDELPESTQEFNRNMVRELPAFQARTGFQIYRLNAALR